MIPSHEKLITFREAVQHVPPRLAGQTVKGATLYRWADRGLRGVRLEFVQAGGVKCTSVEALRRFYAALTDAAVGGKAPS
jgi:hypothetical protein